MNLSLCRRKLFAKTVKCQKDQCRKHSQQNYLMKALSVFVLLKYICFWLFILFFSAFCCRSAMFRTDKCGQWRKQLPKAKTPFCLSVEIRSRRSWSCAKANTQLSAVSKNHFEHKWLVEITIMIDWDVQNNEIDRRKCKCKIFAQKPNRRDDNESRETKHKWCCYIVAFDNNWREKKLKAGADGRSIHKTRTENGKLWDNSLYIFRAVVSLLFWFVCFLFA